MAFPTFNQIYLDALKHLSVNIIYQNERIGKIIHVNSF